MTICSTAWRSWVNVSIRGSIIILTAPNSHRRKYVATCSKFQSEKSWGAQAPTLLTLLIKKHLSLQPTFALMEFGNIKESKSNHIVLIRLTQDGGVYCVFISVVYIQVVVGAFAWTHMHLFTSWRKRNQQPQNHVDGQSNVTGLKTSA